METVTIQIKNNKAYKLLKDLEALNVIKILKQNIVTKKKLSEKYAGKLPLEIADKLQAYTAKSRDEWK